MSSKKITYSIDLDANLDNLSTKLSAAKNQLSKLMENGGRPELSKVFTSIENALDKIRTKASQPLELAGFKSLAKETETINDQLAKFNRILTEIKHSADSEQLSLLSENELKTINSAITATNEFSKSLELATKETVELTKAKTEQAKIEKKLSDQENKKAIATQGAAAIKSKIDETKTLQQQSKARLDALQKEKEETQKRIDEIKAIHNKLLQTDGKVDKRKRVQLSNGTSTTLAAQQKKMSKIESDIGMESVVGNDLSTELRNQEQTLKKFEGQILSAEGNIAGLSKQLELCTEQVTKFSEAFAQISSSKIQEAYSKLRARAESLGISLEGIPLEATEEGIDQLNAKLSQLSAEGLDKATQKIEEIENQSDKFKTAMLDMAQQTDIAKESLEDMQEQANMEEAFANKIKQFVGAAGAAKFFSDACRQAFATVKELDAVMTEMSVVTELDVGDYWDQLPEYTQRANELGISIKSAYESATLFYQQGLDTNEVVALSNQTLKMAKIAGLDAAEATDRMTAALRGFNMELNEASAQKVADVYSQLAAITASDVDEISTAMTKTASIASSAGMEFETTAAFLSQIIETTRESAETAGTAMKTVIARFQELKKDPSEIGEVDGEIVDANKIETALRSVGVALRDSSGQFRDLDDVFMELAGKWDSLDTNTQRYIATIAAGSRQQSRFIAMMSDYGRTQELVAEAQNSAGASSRQYEKTMDSLESKLTRLENAWNEFTTGIMNSDFVKGAVDILTAILNTLNKVTQGFGKMSGMFSKIGTAFAIFKVGQALIEKFGKKIMSVLTKAGESLGVGLKKSLEEGKKSINELDQEAKRATEKNKQDSSDGLIKPMTQTEADEVVKPIEKSLGQAIKRVFTKHFNTLGSLKQSQKALERNGQAYTAARDYMTEEGKTEQQGWLAGQLAGQENQDLRSVMGDVGYNISAKTMDLSMGGDYFKQYMQSAGINKNQYEIENGQATSTFAEGSAELEQFKTLVNRWNEIVSNSTEHFESFNQTCEAINDAMEQNAQELSGRTGETAQNSSLKVSKAASEKAKQDKSKYKTSAKKKDQTSDKTKAKQEVKELTEEERRLQELQEENTKKMLANADKQVEAYKAITKGLGNVATAVSLVGVGFGALGSTFEEMGVDSWANAFYSIGNAMTMAGGILTGLVSVMGILNPLIKASAWASLLKADASKKEALAEKDVIAATLADMIAKHGLLAVTLILTAAIAALVAVCVGLVALFSWIASTTPEAKLKEAEKAAEGAAEAADEAAESYKNLKSALDALDDKYKGLEELTQGTEEWNEAVKDINESVLDLIDQYPELAAFVGNKNGVLTLDVDSEAVQGVINDYNSKSVGAKSAELVAKQMINAARDVVEYEGLSDKALLDSEEDTRALAKALAQGLVIYDEQGNVIDSATNKEGLDELGLTIEEVTAFGEQLGDAADELKEFGQYLLESESNVNALYSAMSVNALQLTDTSKFTKQQLSATTTIVDDMALKRRFENSEGTVASLTDGQLMAKLEELGYNNVTGECGEDESDEFFYEDANGNEKVLERDAAMAQITAAQATEDAAKAMKQIPTLFKELNSSISKELQGKAYSDLLSGRGESISMANAGIIESHLNSTETNYLSSIWNELSTNAQSVFGTYEEFTRIVQEEWDLVKDLKDETDTMKSQYGFDVHENTSVANASAYSKNMEKLSRKFNFGLEGTALQTFSDTLTGLANSMTEEDFNLALQTINSLDWSNAAEWESLPDLFEQLGIKIPSAALENFIDLAIETNNAIKEIDLEKFNNHLIILTSTIDQILSGNQDLKGFSKEFVNSLTEFNKDLANYFIQTNDGNYTYIGTTQDLIQAIKENTIAQLQKEQRTLNIKANVADYLGTHYGESSDLSIANYNNWSESDIDTFLGAMQTYANDNGFDWSSLGLGFSNSTVVAGLPEEDKKTILKDMHSLFAQGSEYFKKQTHKITRDLMSKWRLTQPFETNYQDFNTSEINQKETDAAKQNNIRNDILSKGMVLSAQAQEEGVDATIVGNFNKTLSDLLGIDNWYEDDGSMKKEVQDLLYNETNGLFALGEVLESEYTSFKAQKDLVSEWKSEVDYIANLNERIERSQERQNRLLREYNNLLEDQTATSNDIKTNAQNSVQGYKEEATRHMESALAARYELELALSDDNNEFNKYIQRDENGAIIVNEAEVKKAYKDKPELGEAFDEYVEYLKGLQDKEDKGWKGIEDIEASVKEIEEQGKDGYNNLLSEVVFAIKNQYQKEIDSLSNINSSIKEASDNLANKLQEQLDDERQARENERMEENLQNSLVQTAYLQRDTQGSNALAILQAKEQFEEQELSYQDSLLDQSLQQLEESNNVAIEQRDKQIDLMKTQLDQYSESNSIWEEAKALLDETLGKDGSVQNNLFNMYNELGYLNDKNPIEKQEFTDSLGVWAGNYLKWSVFDTADGDGLTIKDYLANIYDNVKPKEDEVLGPDDIWDKISSMLGTDEANAISELAQAQIEIIKAGIEITKQKYENAETNSQPGSSSDLSDIIDQLPSGTGTGTGLGSTVTPKPTEKKQKYQIASFSMSNDDVDLHDTLVELKNESGETKVDGTYMDIETLTGDKDGNIVRDGTNEGLFEGTEHGNVIKIDDQYYWRYHDEFIPFSSSDLEEWAESSGATWSEKSYAVKEGNAYSKEKRNFSGSYVLKGADATNKGFEDQGSYELDMDEILSKDDEEGFLRTRFGDFYIETLTGSIGLLSKGKTQYANLNDGDIAYNGGIYYWCHGNHIIPFKMLDEDYKHLLDYGNWKAFKQGGLADFTGPAWLDGTPSKPEYILNAAQTESFFRLVDVLDSLNLNSSSSSAGGDNYFDININVDSIEGDYDVDQMAERIKSIIYEDSMYRNVNTINHIR